MDAGWMNAGVCVLSYPFALTLYNSLQSSYNLQLHLQSSSIDFFSCGFLGNVNFGNSLKQQICNEAGCKPL